MSEWRETTLGEACEEGGGFIRTGPFGSQLHQSDYVDDPSGIPVVMPKDMIGGRIDLNSTARIGLETAERLSHHLLVADDIVLSRRGDVGRSVWVAEEDLPALCGTGSMRIHPGKGGPAERQYLRYFMRSRSAIDYLEGQAVGATMPNLNAGIVAGLPLTLPPPGQQVVAGEILRALDDLIENNRRRIGLLEQMAQVIYREWFVHFRYPGHEDDTLVDSPLGPIPEGWHSSTCGESLTVVGGGTPSKNEQAYWDGGTIPWYTPSDLTKCRTRFAAEPELRITEEGLRKSSARLFPTGSVLMTSRATLGVLAMATTDAACNQGFIVIAPDGRWPPTFIYEWLDDHAEELEALGTGATFKEITKGAFKRVRFLVPAAAVLDAFSDVVTPVDGEVRVLEEANRNLAAIRDLLLPKLVTGEIDVSNLDLDAVIESVA